MVSTVELVPALAPLANSELLAEFRGRFTEVTLPSKASDTARAYSVAFDYFERIFNSEYVAK